MTGATRTALVVAAPTLLRQGLVAMLREAWPQLLLSSTADVTQVAELVARRAFGVVVLDGALPGRALPSLLTQLHHARPGQHLLVLAERSAVALYRGALVRHSTRLVPHQVPPAALVAALAPWLNESVPSPPPRAATRLANSGFSPRELEVLRLVMDDNCNEEIADRLCLSVRTIESHRRMLLQKAGTRTLVGLAARAVREGWVA